MILKSRQTGATFLRKGIDTEYWSCYDGSTMSTYKKANKNEQLPEWAIHIEEVYSWAARPTIFGGELLKRTVRWYSSAGLLPLPEHFGKNAYYDRRNIFCYLQVIEILNKTFKLSLPATKIILDKIKAMPSFKFLPGRNKSGAAFPIADIYDFLVDFIISEMDTYRAEAHELRGADDKHWIVTGMLKTCDLKAGILTALLGNSSEIEHMIVQGFKPFQKSVEAKLVQAEQRFSKRRKV